MQEDNSIEETEMINKINNWLKKFAQSSQLDKIDFPGYFWAQVIIGYFCVNIFLEKGLNPENWDHYIVKKSTQQLMNLELTDNFNDYIPQVLSSFLSFLEQKSSLPSKRKFSLIVKDVSPKKTTRKDNKKTMRLIEISEPENKILSKLKKKNKVKQWLKKLEQTAKNKNLIESIMSDIFSFADVINLEQQNEIQDFYIYCNERVLSRGGNPNTEFFQVLSDFALMLDWPLIKEKTITDLYSERKGKFNKKEKELLSELKESFLGIYQVKKVNASSYILKDIFTEEEIELNAFGLDISNGKFLIGRLVKINSEYYAVGPAINIAQNPKAWLTDEIKSDYSDDMPDSAKSYVKNNPIKIVALLNSMDSQAETSGVVDVFQADFCFQNRKVVYKRLNSAYKIKIDQDTASDCDIFYWSESGANMMEAIFLLYKDHLLVRTPKEEMLEKAINFLKQHLSFAVTLENKEIVNISSEEHVETDAWPEDMRLEVFWETALDIGLFENQTPREMLQTEQGREIVIILLEYLELMNYFDYPLAFLNQNDIANIREELDITTETDNVLNDGVEKLLVKNNS